MLACLSTSIRAPAVVVAFVIFCGCSSDSDGDSPGADGAAGAMFEAGPSDARSDAASSDSESSDAQADVTSQPALAKTLRATGFFQSVAADGSLVLADGVREYTPRYPLWSDGAEKKRWVYLPPDSKIDTSDPNHWSFPVGAKFWKEFAIAGKRVETRLVERYGLGQDDFLYATYWWKSGDAGTPADAELVPTTDRVLDVNGSDHDIPSGLDCHRCHDPLQEHVLGFGTLQLTPPPAPAPAPAGVTIQTLSAEGWLTEPMPSGAQFPGNDRLTRDALGYLHANCGNCHNDAPGVPFPDPKMNFRVSVGQTAEQTGAYVTALNVRLVKFEHPYDPPILYRIVGGNPSASAVSFMMSLRGTGNAPAADQMPPLATQKADTVGVQTVNDWIKTLPALPDW